MTQKPIVDPNINKRNDINQLTKLRHLAKCNLDLDSPRLCEALDNLGIDKWELKKKEINEFAKKGVNQDVIKLRFDHYQQRLIDTINRVLEER